MTASLTADSRSHSYRLVDALTVVGASARMQVIDLRFNPLVWILGVVQPAVLVAVGLLPARDPDSLFAAQVAGGALLTSSWSTTVWACAGILRRERFQGTLAPIIIGVRDSRLVLAGKSVGASAGTIVLITATIACELVALGQPIWFPHPALTAVALLLVTCSGFAGGMLIGSLFILTRYGPQLSSALMYPVFLLGGMLVPVHLIPSWIRWASWTISLHWAQELMTSPAPAGRLLGPLGALVGLSLAYTGCGAWVFAHVQVLARRGDSVDLF